MKLDRILVATDFSEPSRQAAAWAAKQLGPHAELTLFHCVNAPMPPAFLRSAVPHLEQIVESERVGAQKRLEDFAAEIGLQGTCRVTIGGRAHEAIVSCSKDSQADMILIGPHGERGTLGELMMGSVPEKLIRSTDTPLFVARGMTFEKPTTILSPVDDSETARHAFEWAVHLGKLFGAKVIAFQSVPTWYAHQLERVASDKEAKTLIQEQLRIAQEWLDRFAQDFSSSGVTIETKVLPGNPDATILLEAAEARADVIVMGSRGSGGASPFLGSVARYVLRNAKCSTMVASAAHPA
ncbi:MAG: universal stress protein [Planctomycetota bacterium]